MDRESIRQCMLQFGRCWNNPPKLLKEPKGYSNTPHGVIKPDMDSRGFLK